MTKVLQQIGPRPAAKAWVGGLVTLGAYAAARFAGLGVEPAAVEVVQAVQVLGEAALAGLANAAAVWLTRNR